ncbi:MAG TPA: DUF4082 domain-containing protein [Polyangiaceae bacterium]|nr:DUF4082 domain-containing protein [Polyangiaceae bacterium]
MRLLRACSSFAPVFLVSLAAAGCFSGSSGGTQGGATFDTGLGEDVTFPEAGHDAAMSTDAPSDATTPDAAQEAGTDNEAILVPGLGSGFDYHQGSYDLGWYFIVNSPITITALGFYDDKKDGLTSSHPVAVYDKATQQMLAQATVSPSDPLTGYFRYTPLAPPLALQQGHTYVLITLVGSENYLAFNALDPSWTVNPAITYSGGAVNYGNPAATTLLYPDTFGTSGGDFGPDFEFSQ